MDSSNLHVGRYNFASLYSATTLASLAIGISRDIFLGALLDTRADVDRIVNAVKTFEKFVRCENIEVTPEMLPAEEFHAKKVNIEADGYA